MTDEMVLRVVLPAVITVMPGDKSAVALRPVTTAEVVSVVPVRAGALVPTTELMVNASLAPSVRTTNSPLLPGWMQPPPLMVAPPAALPDLRMPLTARICELSAIATLLLPLMLSVVKVALVWADRAPVICWWVADATEVVAPLVLAPASGVL